MSELDKLVEHLSNKSVLSWATMRELDNTFSYETYFAGFNAKINLDYSLISSSFPSYKLTIKKGDTTIREYIYNPSENNDFNIQVKYLCQNLFSKISKSPQAETFKKREEIVSNAKKEFENLVSNL